MPDRNDHNSPFASFLKNLMPATRMGQAMLAGMIIWFLDWTFGDSETNTLLGSRLLKVLFDVGAVLAFIPLVYFFAKGVRWTVRRLLWRLRRRLVVTYFLIGVLPLVLLVGLVIALGYGVIGQSSSNLAARQLEGYLEQSRAAAQAISDDLARVDLSRADSQQLLRKLQERANGLAPVFPKLSLSVQQSGQRPLRVSAASASSEVQVRAKPAVAPTSPANAKSAQGGNEASQLPEWMNGRSEFHGLVVEEGGSGIRQVDARHVVRIASSPPAVFQLSYPIGAELSAHLSHTTGLTVYPSQALLRSEAGGLEGEKAKIKGYPIFLPVTDWRTGETEERDAIFVDPSFFLPDQIFKRLEQFKSGVGQVLVFLIGGLAVFFLAITLIAITSAAFLTRSITGAVHNLYQGTKRIEAGDLEHEIPTTGRDQLGALAVSFNQMTRSVRELLRVSAEKQRLDQEMRIAAEVQARLFPRAIPKTAALDMAPGICIPARAVSGDYYDFLEVAPGVTGLVVADVCGKGMSAALLMANLQANLRGQVQAYYDAYHYKVGLAAKAEAAEGGGSNAPAGYNEALLLQHPVQRIIQRVNRQIQASIVDSRYVTLFYAEFNEQTSTLRYTNAGHNPPVRLRPDGDGAPSIERLDRGGPVLGLFTDAQYEEAELHLAGGDLLAIFTDGLIEAHSPQGEEFSDERLISLLTDYVHLPAVEIEHLILQAVKHWTGGAEQEDDLTLVILKVR